MGLKILHNGQISDFSGSKYEPNGYGTKRLKIRTGAGVKEYGLATSAAHTSDKRVRFNIDGVEHYIGTSSALSRQSDYTSSSTYYTYTYTQTESASSNVTSQGTATTATKTQLARYTYRASYYTGYQSGYTVQTSSKYHTRSALLSSTRSSGYTAYYEGLSYQYRGYGGTKSITRQATNSKNSFANGSTMYTITSQMQVESVQTGSFTSSASIVTSGTYYGSESHTLTYNARTNTAGGTKLATYNISQRWVYQTQSSIKIAVTATRASNIYVTPPNNYGLGPWSGAAGEASGNVAVAAGNYRTSSSESGSTGAHVANVSFGSTLRQYFTNLYSSSTQRNGNATMTSTATPIGGVPANYTLSAGPSVIQSQASYTYTDNSCTRTYTYNYSTAQWTNTNTYTSDSPVSSSVGTTATTRVSYYTDHNFI